MKTNNEPIFKETNAMYAKAKRADNGEWIKGYAVPVGEKLYIVSEANVNSDENALIINATNEVDKKTLCNFTGKWTVKGERVWENDKVVYHFDENVIGYVRFGPYINVFPNDMHVDEVHYGFYVEWPTRPNMRKDIGYWFGTEGMETVVAGNLYD